MGKRVAKKVVIGGVSGDSTGSARILLSGPGGEFFSTDTFSAAPLIDGKRSAIELNASNMANSVGTLLAQAIGRVQTAELSQYVSSNLCPSLGLRCRRGQWLILRKSNSSSQRGLD
jgi:hypothetical protein